MYGDIKNKEIVKMKKLNFENEKYNLKITSQGSLGPAAPSPPPTPPPAPPCITNQGSRCTHVHCTLYTSSL